MTLGQRIQSARKAKNLTQKQLAELIGVVTGTIQQYELNKRQPRIEQLQKIADALDTSIQQLLGLGESSYPPEHSDKLIDLYIHGILHWINDRAYTPTEQANIKEHFSQILGRYKEVLSTIGNAKYSPEMEEKIQRLSEEGHDELIPVVKEQFFREVAKHQLQSLVAFANNLAWYIAKGNTTDFAPTYTEDDEPGQK